MELKDLKSVGPKICEKLNNLGIYNVDDLVRYYPYRFDVFKKRDINDERFYDNFVSDAIVESNPVINYFGKRQNRLSFRCLIQNKIVKVVIFNRGFLKNNIGIGKSVTVIGKYNSKTETIIASNILLYALEKEEIIPAYHLCSGITNKKINAYINEALDGFNIGYNIPDVIKDKYNFLNEIDALKIVHSPKDELSLKRAIRTLKYEELFTYMKNLYFLKKKKEIHDKSYSKNIDLEKVREFIDNLPFKLTLDQLKVINEMLFDLKSDVKMNRLLQGDVGSGKTIVAFVLSYACYLSGYQSAFMAPTEVLAVQHYQNAVNLFNNYDIKLGLLTGKTSLKEKKEIYERVKSGDIDLLIGTHSLINDKVVWNNLGLVITDEQHRFGVNQRLKLKNKADNLDVLLMSATPIPRTYALTLYGDTDISSIKTMPKGRKPIITLVKKKDEIKSVLERIYEEIKNKRQVYVISPMIEENEDTDYTNVYDLKHKFELAFKNYKTKILHGKMSKEEKDEIMEEYKNNKINILISTTVIEVGVDVKNATVMVIFDADRFGLSTLHQLRGRVGRNDMQSYCFLISDKNAKRLKIMEEVSDGYKISEEDFKLRGEGDLFGNKQSGAINFKLSDIRRDYELLLKVKNDVKEFYMRRKANENSR